jgi:hypothetical protein
VILLSTTWCIPHLGVSCVGHNNSRIMEITHNTNSDSSSRNKDNNSSSSSTVLLLHHRSRLPLGHHSSFPLATFHASTIGRWGTLLMNATNPSKATHHDLRHPWSINRGANIGFLHHGLAVPTIAPWMTFPWEKKC